MADLVLEYEPRVQFIPFHQRSQRWACMVVHRRAGKTVACVNDLIAKAIYTNKKQARYAYIAPFYRQAKDVAWQYLKEFAKPIISKIRESELRVELINGSWITLYGADNPDALRGLYLDGVIIDEFGDTRPQLWGTVILPTLVDRGGWAVFIGTPKGKNEFYRINHRAMKEEGWYHLLMRASQSKIVGEAELEEMRAQMSEEQYEQEMECSFDAALPGTYYAKHIATAEAEGRYTPLEYVPEQPVYVAGDIGRRDTTALIFWQERPDGIAIIDFEENSGQDVDFYIEMLDSKGYSYEEIWLPHDSKAKTLATKRSTLEQFIDYFGTKVVKLGPKLAIQDGIEAVRKVLPRVWFNSQCPRMEAFMDALRSYKRVYNEMKRTFMDAPDHDWASNPADGMRYAALVMMRGQNFAEKITPTHIITPDSPNYHFTLKQLFDDNERPTNWNTHRI